MQTIQHSQVLLYVLTTTGSLYSSQKSTTNNIQLIAQYKQKTTLDHSNSLLRIYDLTLAADFLLYTDRERRKSWKVIIYHVSPNNCGCASELSTTMYYHYHIPDDPIADDRLNENTSDEITDFYVMSRPRSWPLYLSWHYEYQFIVPHYD